jgi:hypothetical protein
MAHYAELNESNEVINIIYMENKILLDESGNESENLGIQYLHIHHGDHRRWIQTSYNENFRGNYASIGYTYREDIDCFISPQPFSSWHLNENSGKWEAPIPEPNDDNWYIWSEEEQMWKVRPKK